MYPKYLKSVESGNISLSPAIKGGLRQLAAHNGEVVNQIRTESDLAVAMAAALPLHKQEELLRFLQD